MTSTSRMTNSTPPYIGSLVSLTTNSQVRYEGILYTIDSNKCTIYLSKVRIYGTEERPTKRPIPARDETFDYIVFKASDIQDMVVVEQAKHSELFVDPAIVSCSGTTTDSRYDHPPPMMHTSPENLSGKLRDLMLQGRNTPEIAGREFTPRASRIVTRTGLRQKTPLQMHYGTVRPYDEHTGKTPIPPPKDRLKFDSDYDYQKANEQFQHESMKSPKADGHQGEEKKEDQGNADKKDGEHQTTDGKFESCDEELGPFYDKSVSFYDGISCDKSEGASRPEWKRIIQRQHNEETFGPSAARTARRSTRYGSNGEFPVDTSFVSRPPPTLGLTFVNGGGGNPYGLGLGGLGGLGGIYGSALGLGGLYGNGGPTFLPILTALPPPNSRQFSSVRMPAQRSGLLQRYRY